MHAHKCVILIQAHPRDKVFVHSALEARPLGLFNVLVADHLWTWAQCETFVLLRPSFRNFSFGLVVLITKAKKT